MSEDRDLDSIVTVNMDGISVDKRYEPDQFAVPAIEFSIRSELDESATVTLVDHIPESFPMDSVGFHPDYENDNWTAFKDHRVQFERTFKPGEEVVTVYGIRLTDSDSVAEFLTDPEVESSANMSGEESPPDPLESALSDPESLGGPGLSDIISEDGNQVVRDVLSGDRDSLPGMEDETVEASASADPLDDPLAAVTDDADKGTEAPDPLADSVSEVEASPENDVFNDPESTPEQSVTPRDGLEEDQFVDDEPDDDADSTADDPTEEKRSIEVEPSIEDEPTDDFESELITAEPNLPTGGNVAGALAEEIRQNSISDADLALLRQELDVTLPESTNVRIRHLQSRVEDLTAYTEALEEFIDDNGTAKTFVDEFETFEGNVEGLREEVEELEDEIDEVQDLENELQIVSDIERTVESIQEGQAATSDRIDDLETEVRAFSTRSEEIESNIESVSDTVEADLQRMSEDVESTSTELDNLQTDVAALQELETDITQIQSAIDDISQLESKLEGIEALRTDVSAARIEIEELEELVGANTEDITNLSETLQNVEAELAGVTDIEGDLLSIDEQVDQLTETVQSTEQSVESAVEDLQSDVQTINDDIEEIRTWRDQLTSVFGPGDGN